MCNAPGTRTVVGENFLVGANVLDDAEHHAVSALVELDVVATVVLRRVSAVDEGGPYIHEPRGAEEEREALRAGGEDDTKVLALAVPSHRIVLVLGEGRNAALELKDVADPEAAGRKDGDVDECRAPGRRRG